MRTHPRKEAGIVVDFVVSRPRTPTASSRSTRCSTPTSTARARASRRRRVAASSAARAASSRRRTWLVPVTPDVARRLAVIQREWQRIDPKYMDEDEQRYWATIAGRQLRFDQRAEFAKKFAESRASKVALEKFLSICAAENPNRRLRMTALQDRVSMIVERADFDDLVTLVSQAPPWEKDRAAGVRILLRAIGEGKANAPDQILQRWTWKLARGDAQDPGPPRERRVPRGEAAARRGRELARPPPRGERGPARAGREGAAARGRSSAARLGRGLHAARELGARPRARGARRDDRRSRTRSPTTCPRRRRPRASRAGGASGRRAASGAGPGAHGSRTDANRRRTDAALPARTGASSEQPSRPRRRRRRTPSPPRAAAGTANGGVAAPSAPPESVIPS